MTMMDELDQLETLATEHTFSKRCPLCPGEHGGPGPCDHARYGARYLRFARRHLEGLSWGPVGGEGRSGSNQAEYLRREWALLPPRHDCTCICPREQVGCARWSLPKHNRQDHRCEGPPSPPCPECVRIRQQLRELQIPESTSGGGRGMAHSPTPDPLLLDLITGFAWPRAEAA